MHSFYYAIVAESNDSSAQERIENIESAAAEHGLSFNTEKLSGVTTIQVETDDDETVVTFKLAAEIALHEQHD